MTIKIIAMGGMFPQLEPGQQYYLVLDNKGDPIPESGTVPVYLTADRAQAACPADGYVQTVVRTGMGLRVLDTKTA